MEQDTRMWHFENFNIFKTLSEPEKQAVISLSQIKEYKKKQIIYLQGDSSDHIYFLKSGKIKISKYSHEGKEMILSILGPGQIFGEMSISFQDTRDEVAEVVNDCSLYIIKAEDLTEFIAGNPHFPLQMVKLMGERVKKNEKRLESLYFKTVFERVKELILQLSLENGKEKNKNGNKEIEVDLFLTHDEIAKLTATNRQTVTSVLKDLEKLNIISYSRKLLIIKNLQALHNGL